MHTGKALRRIRNERGLSAQEVALLMGFATHKSILDIEYGLRKISEQELKLLLQIYKASPDDLINDKPKLSLRLRTKSDILSSESYRELENIEEELYLFNDLVTKTKNKIYSNSNWQSWIQAQYGKPKDSKEASQQGDRLSLDLRSKLNIGDSPIENILSITETLGIKVFGLNFKSDDISGLFINLDKLGPIIFVNILGNKYDSRLTFSIAHEICHFLADDHNHNDNDYSKPFDYAIEQKYIKDFCEVRANAFAASFLMPKNSIEEFYDTFISKPSYEVDIFDICKIQHRYKTSFSSTLYRLLNLGLISKAHFAKLKEGHQSKKLEYEDALSLFGLKSSQYEDLKENKLFNSLIIQEAIEAYYKKLISLGKLQELAGKLCLHNQVKDVLKLKGRP